ncbi:hypothetical protein Droror1_Dr00024499, partial [Drosera rotundifolia]
LKTVIESMCDLWGQTALKEKEVILGEDAPEGFGAAEGSRKPPLTVLKFRPEQLPYLPHFTIEPNLIRRPNQILRKRRKMPQRPSP